MDYIFQQLTRSLDGTGQSHSLNLIQLRIIKYIETEDKREPGLVSDLIAGVCLPGSVSVRHFCSVMLTDEDR